MLALCAIVMRRKFPSSTFRITSHHPPCKFSLISNSPSSFFSGAWPRNLVVPFWPSFVASQIPTPKNLVRCILYTGDLSRNKKSGELLVVRRAVLIETWDKGGISWSVSHSLFSFFWGGMLCPFISCRTDFRQTFEGNIWCVFWDLAWHSLA